MMRKIHLTYPSTHGDEDVSFLLGKFRELYPDDHASWVAMERNLACGVDLGADPLAATQRQGIIFLMEHTQWDNTAALANAWLDMRMLVTGNLVVQAGTSEYRGAMPRKFDIFGKAQLGPDELSELIQGFIELFPGTFSRWVELEAEGNGVEEVWEEATNYIKARCNYRSRSDIISTLMQMRGVVYDLAMKSDSDTQ